MYYRTWTTKVISLDCSRKFYNLFQWCYYWSNINKSVPCLYKTRHFGRCSQSRYKRGVSILLYDINSVYQGRWTNCNRRNNANCISKRYKSHSMPCSLFCQTGWNCKIAIYFVWKIGKWSNIPNEVAEAKRVFIVTDVYINIRESR